MMEYFNYLEETYLIQRIPRFAASQKASMSAPKKVYDGTECDFVVERRDGSFSAVQVCWELSHDNEDREKNFAYFANLA